MSRKSHPRRGSLQFNPRWRAGSEIAHISKWVEKKDAKVLGFCGYKVGLIHGLMAETNQKSPLKGQERQVALTVVEAPPLKVVGYRFYDGTAVGEVWANNLPKELGRTLKLPKKEKNVDIDALKAKAKKIVLIVSTQPYLAGFPKKRPEIMEYGLAGELDVQLKTGQEFLGKEIAAKDILKPGDYLDAFSITKGKGFQGPVKRHGVSLLPPKTKRSRRKPGNIGGWVPKHSFWGTPMPGKMGFYQRCEFNKRLLKIGEKGFPNSAGWPHYGTVKSDYLLFKGSLGGPAKRLVRFRFAIRSPKHISELPQVRLA